MSARRSRNLARAAGGMLGCAAALALLFASQPASGGAAAGADISLAVPATGELLVDPPAPRAILHERSLRAGESADGGFELTNQTGGRLAVELRPTSSDPALDGSLRVTFTSGGRTLFDGTIAAPAVERPLRIRPGESAHVVAAVALPADADPALTAAALVELSVALDTTAEGP